jgi:hypothetical protein
MPATPEPWNRERLPSGHFRISGPVQADGNSNLIAVVDGFNPDADAALIASSPTMLRFLRDTVDHLFVLEMAISEVRRVVSVDREFRLVVPMLTRIRDHRAAVQDVLARAEAV